MRKEFKIISRVSNSPIAFSDSGVGGLTVYSKLRSILPNENYIYFGDTLHMPYGEKSEAQLVEYTKKIFDFFGEKGVKAVVMACNTTSSVVYDKIKDKYPFKIYPIIQSAAGILAKLPIKTLGVFATHATVSSGVYKREIQKYNPDMEVIQIACPEWVKIVEEDKINNPESVLKIKEKVEDMLKYNPEKIVLGCTHYPYMTNVLSRFAQKEMFIDPAVYFAEYIKFDLEKNNLLANGQGKEEIYVSANVEGFVKAAEIFYKVKTQPQLALCD